MRSEKTTENVFFNTLFGKKAENMIRVLEVLKAPKFETVICNIDKDGRTDCIKVICENDSEVVKKFRIYKPLTCFSDSGVEYIDIYRIGNEKIKEIRFI